MSLTDLNRYKSGVWAIPYADKRATDATNPYLATTMFSLMTLERLTIGRPRVCLQDVLLLLVVESLDEVGALSFEMGRVKAEFDC
jgi:hypothetical protein